MTGSGGGIGEATADALARRGHRVVVADLDGERAAAVADRLRARGVEAMGARVDVTDESGFVALVERTVGAWGRVDVLVNNAGVESALPFLDIPVADFERVMRVNTTGAWIACRAVLPQMLRQGGGAIVNVSSVAAQRGGGLLGTAAYATSKGALIALTKALAREFARAGVRANAVAPALTMTELAQRQLAGAPPGTLERIHAMTPLGRSAQPHEIASVIAFLASDDAAFVTGHVYNVDGGLAM